MKKKILCLATMMIMAVGSVTNVQAEDFAGSKDWTAVFNGERIESNFASEDLADDMKNVQPGDSITFQVKLSNSSEGETDWYMTNEVLQTLEESNDSAEGGAYTYILTYMDQDGNETVLYNSETVGGEEDTSKEGEGLHQATNSLEDYFYLDSLKKDEKGTVTLYVEIEGETTGIDYQETLARLKMNFAVEKAAQGKVITTVKTGDPAQLMTISITLLVSAVVLLVLAVGLIKKQRKGE